MRRSVISQPRGHDKLRGVTRLPQPSMERKLLSGVILNCCVVFTVAANYNPCNQPGLATRVCSCPKGTAIGRLRFHGHDSQHQSTTKSPLEKGTSITDGCLRACLTFQGRGFYLGVAFWPGGSTDDWGPVYNATSKTFGLNPCNNVTLMENSTLTQQQYLV